MKMSTKLKIENVFDLSDFRLLKWCYSVRETRLALKMMPCASQNSIQSDLVNHRQALMHH